MMHRDERENVFELVFLCVVICLITGVALHLFGIDVGHAWRALADLFW
jgi:hypothetical protein